MRQPYAPFDGERHEESIKVSLVRQHTVAVWVDPGPFFTALPRYWFEYEPGLGP